MTNIESLFLVMISMIGILSIAALAVSAHFAGRAISLENSARFPDPVEICLEKLEAMALVRNALMFLNLSGVKYKITDDDLVTGCIEATASGILNGVPDDDLVDISMSVVFTTVTDQLTRIERNYIVRSLNDKNAIIVIQQTNNAFDKLFISLLNSSPEIKKQAEPLKGRSISQPPLQSKLSPAQIADVPKSDTLETTVDFLPAAEAVPLVVQQNLHRESSVKICPSCNYPLDAGFSFCLHCGR